MPRTRSELEREEKVAEIVEAAARRLRAGGYDALSVVGVARDLGIAQNAVYWYFPSKDHLFVAALEHIMRSLVAGKPPRQQSVERKVLWFVDRLQELEHVRAAMYERARTSEVVADFVTNLDAAWRRMLAGVLASRLDEPELSAAVGALMATIQGAFLQPLGAAERKRVIAYAVERLVPT
jgi:AcrR family transcriptional regulator